MADTQERAQFPILKKSLSKCQNSLQFVKYFPEASANMARDDHEGDFLLLTYREPSRDKDLATTFKAAWNGVGSPEYELESFPLPIDDYSEIEKIPAFGPFRRSDHRAFWNDNIPAIFISDTGERCCFVLVKE